MVSLSGSALFVADTVIAKSYAVPLEDGEAMMAGEINGPGTLAVIGTWWGRLLRIDLADGQPVGLTSIRPRTYYLTTGGGAPMVVPGSLTRLAGSMTGRVDSLHGRILLDSRPLPILGVSGNTITAQIGVSTGQKEFQIDLTSESPFHAPPELSWSFLASRSLKSVIPGFLSLGSSSLRGISVDMRRSRYKAGAVVHAYMTGLGARAAPSRPESRPTLGCSIRFRGRLLAAFCRSRPTR